MRFHQIIAVAWLALVCALTPARAEKRVALVIGNEVADAQAVARAPEQLGFEVISGENAGRQALVDWLDGLTRRMSSGDTAFFLAKNRSLHE